MGKIVATYLVRVTLHQRDDLPAPADAKPGTFTSESEPPLPKLDEVEKHIAEALYLELPYFTANEIGVSAERVDE